MREYEVTIILKPDLDEAARNELLERLESMLAHGSEEEDKPNVKHWGQRELAYPIKKYTDGYYVFYESRLETSKISELERNLLYIEDILRHLIVRKEI